ncbi:HD domain-containing protein [bacterium]|nr:HD domain-containing protein [bacterium]MCP5461607.1 HD domain-containing protein [bacterium]
MNEKEILDFIAESGQLKRVKRSGWWVAGVADPESVADHSFRTGIVGHILARLENVDPYKVMLMTLYNDIHETRVNDLHKIGHRYIDFKLVEKAVQKEQLNTEKGFKKEIAHALDELHAQVSPESIVARDADILECIIQGKEYYDFGVSQASEWFNEKYSLLKTASAKKLYEYIITNWHSAEWRRNLKRFDR